MHCRVRYLLDFDLKIRSGQVWRPNWRWSWVIWLVKDGGGQLCWWNYGEFPSWFRFCQDRTFSFHFRLLGGWCSNWRKTSHWVIWNCWPQPVFGRMPPSVDHFSWSLQLNQTLNSPELLLVQNCFGWNRPLFAFFLTTVHSVDSVSFDVYFWSLWPFELTMVGPCRPFWLLFRRPIQLFYHSRSF